MTMNPITQPAAEDLNGYWLQVDGSQINVYLISDVETHSESGNYQLWSHSLTATSGTLSWQSGSGVITFTPGLSAAALASTTTLTLERSDTIDHLLTLTGATGTFFKIVYEVSFRMEPGPDHKYIKTLVGSPLSLNGYVPPVSTAKTRPDFLVVDPSTYTLFRYDLVGDTFKTGTDYISWVDPTTGGPLTPAQVADLPIQSVRWSDTEVLLFDSDDLGDLRAYQFTLKGLSGDTDPVIINRADAGGDG